MHPPQNVVSFQSSASTEVAQDQMRLTLNTTLEGSAAQEVQGRLRKAVEAALAEAKPQAQAEKMEVTTGSFRINPRYGKDSKITGWQGYAEVMLEGTDFARITSTAAAIKSLSMGGISFGLSPKTQREAKTLLASHSGPETKGKLRFRISSNNGLPREMALPTTKKSGANFVWSLS